MIDPRSMSREPARSSDSLKLTGADAMMNDEVVTAMRSCGLIFLLAFLCLTASASLAQSQRATLADAARGAASAFEEGQNAQQRGDLHSAVRLYTDAIALDGSLFQAYYQRAISLISLGREGEAEADLKKVIELEPNFARAHRALGQILLDGGKTAEASRYFARAVEMDPNLAGVRLYYASALIKINDHARAIEQLRAAIERGESAPLAFALLGLAYERLGKIDEAFSNYSRAIEIDPDNSTAREGRAGLLASRGEFAKAIEDYAAAYRAQPSPDLALKLAELHVRAGQPQAAIQLYRGLLQDRPDDLDLRIELARLMAENGQAEEARRQIQILADGHLSNAKLLIAAGDIHFADKPDVAAKFYRRALEIAPADNRARVQLGASLVRAMRFEEALTALNEAIAREQDNHAAHANLATALFKLKQYPQAAREFIWLVRSRPDVAASYFFLAISLDRLGDCEQALRAYQEFTRRANPSANKSELEEANIRLRILQSLAKEGKCKSQIKRKGE